MPASHGLTDSLPPLSEEELKHYSRHLLVPQIGLEGQKRLKAARVLIVGAGGLGSPLALYLAAAGVGTLGMVDFDRVDRSNLHRQVMYGIDDIGELKLDAATRRLRALNPYVCIQPHVLRLTANNAMDVVQPYDLVIDGTDNFATRYLVNDTCVLLGKPNVYAAIFRFEGQLSVFADGDGPCYRCLYPEPPPPELVPSCAEGGVFGVLPGIVGALQAAEAVKHIAGVGRSLRGRLLQFDALSMRFSEYAIARDPNCSICGAQASVRQLIDYDQFCSPGPDADRPGVPEIDVWQLSDLMASDQPPLLLDVRTPGEALVNTIPGARSLPLDELESRCTELDPSMPIVCLCLVGKRSEKAARVLITRGFRAVQHLRGGIEAWWAHENRSTPVTSGAC